MRLPGTLTSLVLSVLGIAIASIAPAWANPPISALPEPMSALVFGAGLVGAALVGRRKKK